MRRSHSNRGRSLVLAALVCVGAWFGSPRAVRPAPPDDGALQAPPKLTLEQQKWLRANDRRIAGGYPGAWGGIGRLDQALAVIERTLAIDRAAFGNDHGLVASSLAEIAEVQLRRADFTAARQAAGQALQIQRKLHPESHWRVIQARLACDKVERWAALEPAKRLQLHRAEAALDAARTDLQKGQGTSPRSIPALEAAVEAHRQIFGDLDLDYARGLRNLTRFRRARDRSAPEYRATLERIVDIFRKQLGEKHPEYALALSDLGVCLFSFGQNPQARTLLERAGDIYLESLGETDLEYVDWLCVLAVQYARMSDIARPKALREKALRIVLATRGELDPRCALCLKSLAQQYVAQGALAQAEPLRRRLVAIARQAEGEQHLEYWLALRELSVLYARQGTPREVMGPLQARLQEAERAIRQRRERTLEQAQWLCTLAGDKRPPENEAILREALAIYKEIGGEKSPGYVSTLALLGGVIADGGQSETISRRVQELSKDSAGPAASQSLQRLREQARRHISARAYDKAETLLREVLELARTHRGENHLEYAQSLRDLGSLYATWAHPPNLPGAAATGSPRPAPEDLDPKAESLLLRALRLFEQIEKTRGGSSTGILLELAEHYEHRGEANKGREFYARYLNALKETLDDPNAAWSMMSTGRWNSARALARPMAGMAEQVEPVLHRMLSIDEQLVEESGFAQSEKERLLRLPFFLLEIYLGVALECNPVPVERVYGHVLAWKGAALRLSENRLARDQPELKDLIARLDDSRTRLARLAYSAPRLEKQAEWTRQLTRVRADRQYLESELARRSEAFRRQQAFWRLGPADVARALPPGSVFVDLLEYVRYSRTYAREPRLLLCVVRRDHPPVCVSLPADPIIQATRRWRQALQHPGYGSLDLIGGPLAKRLWEPLKPHLAGARTLLVAPDGALCQVPLGALPGERPGSYLIEDLAVGYVTSGRHLAELFSQAPREDGRGLLTLGGIDYAADPGTRPAPVLARSERPAVGRPQRAGFTFLPGTAVEARHCDQLFRQRFPGEPATLLTAAAAQEGRVKQELGRRHRYLHMATHGFFAPPQRINALRQPGLALAFPPQVGQEGTTADLSRLESGIVLAGAARTPERDDPDLEDGILTAEEVAALDLRSTELVTLSACETGLGRIEPGQGVLGLQQAFAAAGARTLVTSLWQVDDLATVMLMEAFYRNLWEKRLPRLEALRQAQLKILRPSDNLRKRQQEIQAEFAALGLERDLDLAKPAALGSPPQAPAPTHPSLWAAFVLCGDVR